MDEKFVFEFTVGELNVIIAGLRKIPFESSAPLIERINKEYVEEKKKRLEAAKDKKGKKTMKVVDKPAVVKEQIKKEE